ncbi:unnamed protein product [Litomosoides sigmodontis]|uniref:Clc-like protein n=1 Tax=Litomosoides sigmodontis TaxID=42156 RepID=A0A3P6VE03_LITSI|nr:unnamed protein product [Litomosoides sigmodontis]
MSATKENQNKCGQKIALSLFFLLELIAYVLGCIALISPSWQYVYLENGRTEHHHGLWLDCKRDYSHDYGRSREYYETLYRLNKQQSPFDQFFLTSLLCVYKFDYYIDTEDLYDHNHDENRLQDDANQHLLLGWKIASLAALGFAALAASAALLLSVCAFCHRTLICAATVLVTVAALLSSMGLLIFYIWANYQDNNIIKEEDGIYQQYFGWALYVQLVGTTMQFLASFVGCAVTSMAFRSRTKLVKIEVVDRDNSTLLDRTASLPFKRSFSAVYKLDSADLEKWEKDYTNIVQSDNIAKRSILKASKQYSTMSNANRRLSNDPDLTYEYLPGDSVGNSRSTETLNKSFTSNFADTNLFVQIKGSPSQRTHSGSSMNVYDKVYEPIADTAKLHDRKQTNSCKNIAGSADKVFIRSEQNASFRFSSGPSLNNVLDDIAINTFDLGTFSGRERERCLGDEMDRSVGSSDALANSATDEGSEQWHEAQLCLNLFMNGRAAPLIAGHSSGDGLAETKKSSITTV